MKYLILCTAMITAASIGYYLGFRAADQEKLLPVRQKLAEDDLTGRLLSHLAVYDSLQKAGPGLAKDNLKVYIEGDVATYDFYRKEAPTFGDKTDHLQELVKQARAVEDEK